MGFGSSAGGGSGETGRGQSARRGIVVPAFLICHADGLQQELAEIGEDRGLTEVYTTVGEHTAEVAEDVIDGGSGAQIGDAVHGVLGVAYGLFAQAALLGFEVRAAEGDVGVDARHAAAAAVCGGLGAAGGVIWLRHVDSP